MSAAAARDARRHPAGPLRLRPTRRRYAGAARPPPRASACSPQHEQGRPTSLTPGPAPRQLWGYGAADEVRHSDHRPVRATLAVPFRAGFRPAAFASAVESANAAVARYRGPKWY